LTKVSLFLLCFSCRSTVLSVATSRLQQSTNENTPCLEPVAPSNVLFIANQFILMSSKLPEQLIDSNTANHEVQEVSFMKRPVTLSDSVVFKTILVLRYCAATLYLVLVMFFKKNGKRNQLFISTIAT
jgi:hypothetical protein